MKQKTFVKYFTAICASACALVLALLQTSCSGGYDRDSTLLVSVADQQMLLSKKGKPVKIYPISTSKFGLGSRRGSKRTPLGKMEVAQKIGSGAPLGAVFKGRRRTGEVLRPNAPGRDPIVTRIMWLKGKQYHNRNTYGRYIYIHGTPEERKIGRPASYGCIRMGSRDVTDLYRHIGVGANVNIIRGSLPSVCQDGTNIVSVPVSRQTRRF